MYVRCSVGGAQVGDVAQVREGKAPGLVERYNMQRVVSMTANVHGETHRSDRR